MNAEAKKRYFDYLEKNGKLPKMGEEGGPLPGETELDDEMGLAHDPDSSGDPEPEEYEKEHITQYMNKGGKVHNSDFAKALRKRY